MGSVLEYGPLQNLLRDSMGPPLPFLCAFTILLSGMWMAPSWTMKLRSPVAEPQSRWSGTLVFVDVFLRKKFVLVKPRILWASCHSQPNLILTTNIGTWSARHIQFLSHLKLLTVLPCERGGLVLTQWIRSLRFHKNEHWLAQIHPAGASVWIHV